MIVTLKKDKIFIECSTRESRLIAMCISNYSQTSLERGSSEKIIDSCRRINLIISSKLNEMANEILSVVNFWD
jgi:hypothetical protein